MLRLRDFLSRRGESLQLEALTRQVEAVSPAHVDPQDYRSSSAA